MTLEELSRRLPHYNEFDGAQLAIQMLLKSGRVSEEVIEGRVVYKPITRHHNLVSDDWEMRIDALSEHIGAVGETLHRRFLEAAPDPLTLARTFTFQAREEDIQALQVELLEFIRERYRELEERALAELESSEPDAQVTQFSLYVGVTPTPQHDGGSHESL